MGIATPTRQQTDINRCGACKVRWKDCKCKADSRTESVESLFANEDIFPDPERRHTCVFLYHSYQRWSPAHGQGTEDFTLACLPLWEGWYTAWLKPELEFPITVSWSEHPVLKCSLRYFNGTSLDGYIDTDGKLLLSIPAVRPPYGKDYDEDRGLVRMAVGVSQGLTIEEIRKASRGIVYGGRSPPNSWRRVSHVVREEDDTCVARLLDEKGGIPGKEVQIETDRVQQFVPHLLEEVKWRGRRRFRRNMAKEVQRYLYALVERARKNDEAVRFALRMGWLNGLPSPPTIVTEIEEEANAIVGNIASIVGDMATAARPVNAEQRPVKRTRTRSVEHE